jgi:hypothetical protein
MPPPATSLALVRAAALLLVALCLVPTGAHLSELPNKIGLPADQYMLVQQIYRGWALFGSLIVAALAATAPQSSALAPRPRGLSPVAVRLALSCRGQGAVLAFHLPRQRGKRQLEQDA